MEELRAQRKQTQLALDQTAELVALIKKGGIQSGNNTTKDRRGGDGKKEERKCGNCGLQGFHADDDCFSLEKNKDKRPRWYKKKNGIE